ncbi:MAG TPA: hypothetical protein VGD91_19610, partial [Trebonia sp.]
MERLQAAGVPAGVCQTAGDRCDNDPQLRHLDWLTELTGTRIGHFQDRPPVTGTAPGMSVGLSILHLWRLIRFPVRLLLRISRYST